MNGSKRLNLKINVSRPLFRSVPSEVEAATNPLGRCQGLKSHFTSNQTASKLSEYHPVREVDHALTRVAIEKGSVNAISTSSPVVIRLMVPAR